MASTAAAAPGARVAAAPDAEVRAWNASSSFADTFSSLAQRAVYRLFACPPIHAQHAAWLASIKGYKVVVPKFEWSLEWALPTPVPQHQCVNARVRTWVVAERGPQLPPPLPRRPLPDYRFEQSPVVIEVTDRNPAPERLIADGPDTAGGYPDPLEKAGTDKFLTPAEAKARGYGRSAYTREWFTPQGVKKSSPDEAGLFTSAAR